MDSSKKQKNTWNFCSTCARTTWGESQRCISYLGVAHAYVFLGSICAFEFPRSLLCNNLWGGNESQHFQHTQAQNITLGGVLVLKHCQKHHFQHPEAQNIAYSDVLSQATIPPQADRNPPPPRRRTRGDSRL